MEFQSHVQLNKKLPYDPHGWMSNHFSMCGKMALVHKYLCVYVCVCINPACSDEQYRNCLEKPHGRCVCVCEYLETACLWESLHYNAQKGSQFYCLGGLRVKFTQFNTHCYTLHCSLTQLIVSEQRFTFAFSIS